MLRSSITGCFLLSKLKSFLILILFILLILKTLFVLYKKYMYVYKIHINLKKNRKKSSIYLII